MSKAKQSSPDLDSLPPHDREAEAGLLGCALISDGHGEDVLIQCKCGIKVTKRLRHYDITRCACGKDWWALRPKRNEPLVAFPRPEQNCEEKRATYSQMPASYSLPKPALRLPPHSQNGMLTLAQLQCAVAAAKRLFGLILRKYPDLKAHLVLSSPGGQAGIDSSPKEILSKFPAMLFEDETKAMALMLQKILELEALKEVVAEQLRRVLDQLAPQLRYNENCQVEIRFDALKYDLVWKLQEDDLVDHNLTPKTKASIRIVLGTISQFERTLHQY